MIECKLKVGARAVYIGVYKAIPYVVLKVYPSEYGDDIMMDVFDQGAARKEKIKLSRYFVPRKAYRDVHAFKWEAKPYRWILPDWASPRNDED